ncbi:adventurous-gliding motility protein Z-like isoform X2 [Littorina saxatilis]|uniref:Uncharacterized protein n=1 Tax=Littorina saxatilis TaxID=31220 RepID=A0AAN9C498_9CAEN
MAEAETVKVTEGEEKEGDSEGNDAMREKPTGRTGEAVETEGAGGHKEENASNKNQTAKTSKQDTENIEEEGYDGNKDKNGADTSSNKKKSGSEIDEKVDSVESPTGDSAEQDFSKMLASPEQGLFSPSSLAELTGRTQRLEAEHAQEIEDHTREANALKVRLHELSNKLGELQESSEREVASLVEVRGTLRSDCDRLNDRVTELDREGEVKDEKINELSTTISRNSEKVANAEELTKGYQDMDQKRQDAEQLCSSMQRRLDEATDKVQQLEAALQKTTEGLGQEIVQLQANLYRLTNEKDELQTTSENQVAQLTEDRDALRANCDRLKGFVEELTDAKASLEDAKHDLEAAMRDRTRQLEELEDQVAALQAEVQRKDNDTYGLLDTVARQSRALEGKERLEVEHQDVVTRLSDSQHQCATLQASVTELTGRTQRLEAALAQETEDHTHRVTELDREGEVKDEKINELSTTISRNSEKVANAEELTKGYQDMDQKRQDAEQLCSSLQRRLDEATDKIQQLEAALQKTTEGLGRLTEEIVQLQANLYRLTNERDELQTTSENQVAQLTEDRDALRANCDRLKGFVEELTDAKASLEDAKHDLEGKLRRTDKERTNLITANDDLEAQKISSEAAMREMLERTRQLEELKENFEGQVAALQAEVQQKDNDTYGLLDTVARQSRALEGKERLEIEHQDVVTRLSDSQHQCATLQANITELTGRTQRLEAALAQEIEDHTREANVLKVRMHELSNELGDLQESSEREVASLAEVRSTLTSDCDRLNVRVHELETNKKRLEDKNRDLEERLRATERKAEELTTQNRVFERQKKTAEDRSVAYGQTSTVYQAQATQLQDLANTYRAQLETLTAQLRQRNESVLPLEMEARRARQEEQQATARLERTTNEKDTLEITLNALKEEVRLCALATQDWHRKEADLGREVEKQVALKNRYVQETQFARTQVKELEARVRQLELQEANRLRKGFPRLD